MALIDIIKSALVSLGIALALSACASTGIWLDAGTKDHVERLQTMTKGGVRVSTSVLSASESNALYGKPLARKGIQPVWIEVENHDDTPYWLMSLGLDPYYIPASEAADAFAGNNVDTNHVLTQRFQQLAFQNPVPPGATVSGFILTNLHEGVKMVEAATKDGKQ